MAVLVTSAVIVLAALVGWLVLLTVVLRRWRAERGEPVYRRLPDGRLRFEWSVNCAYHSARHHLSPPAGPVPADVSSLSRDRTYHYPGR